ncbi:hypothetical protein M9435_005478 [Picochlorum sp. BPE23]|nr:hypothetical protein M9435_005478 [Picochlorum sp. BPE23]|eukprot:CAMPEP_0118800238 /NCGR_PEP_ID=MMETSP1161-20130426/2216_1 /TAXON_ID=249345 /ORGANISM="Picochlorum oklahomensis, Strain CCMP2329" /LENGTH=278 /DNA_ID=CAMNT_0006728051 /DNA_START=829 /DNA_END=1665 /DNA_ORIENTATION=+
MSSVSPVEHTAIGGLAGLIEVGVMQPTVALKNCLQEGRSFPTNISAYYRGLFINAGAMFPIIATQFGVNRTIEKVLESGRSDPLSNSQKIGMAMVAGSTSSVFGCPAEYLMIHQQRTGKSLIGAFKSNTSLYGYSTIYRGLGATVSREALYAAGYLGLMPILRKEFTDAPVIKDIPGGPYLGAGIAAGIFGTVTTHPSDTIKTRMQAFPDLKKNPEYRTIYSTARHIIQEGGVQAMFAGLVPRGFRIIGAVFILNGVKNTAVDFLEKKRSGETADALS